MSEFVNAIQADSESTASDLAEFARATIDAQSGLSGKLVKGAYAAALKIDSDIALKAARRVLPELAEVLAPYWDAYSATGATGGFGAHLAQHERAVTDSILETADRQIEKVNASALSKVYSPVRGKAEKIVADNLPGLGDLLESHVR